MASTLTIFGVHLVVWLVMAAIIPRRRTAGEAHAWLLVVALLPVIGAASYVFHARTRTLRRARTFASPSPDGPGPPPKSADVQALTARLDALIAQIPGGAAHPWSAFEPLDPGVPTVDAVIAGIASATSSVDLEYFIVANDEMGTQIREALIRAADRGIDCRLLVDAAASHALFLHHRPALEQHGVQIRRMSMVPYRLWPVRRLDLRNHRKLAVFDGRTAIVGSQNMDDRRRASHASSLDPNWLELSVQVSGPVVLALRDVFNSDWRAAANEASYDRPRVPNPGHTSSDVADEVLEPRPHRNGPGKIASSRRLHVIPTGPHAEAARLEDVVHTLIDAAQSHIRIVTPYFVPTDPILSSLRLALLRGVDVRIQVPGTIRPRIARYAAFGYLADLRTLGAQVEVLPSGYLHAKFIAIDDDIRMFGSGNFDARSFWINRELVFVSVDPETAHRLDVATAPINDAVRAWDELPLNRPNSIEQALRQWSRIATPLL
ncbi:MAG: phosphatidylserine/phosphatidylglycerophosphate/cardiolipin synthase family protein [Phycisphaerales bacterium]